MKAGLQPAVRWGGRSGAGRSGHDGRMVCAIRAVALAEAVGAGGAADGLAEQANREAGPDGGGFGGEDRVPGPSSHPMPRRRGVILDRIPAQFSRWKPRKLSEKWVQDPNCCSSASDLCPSASDLCSSASDLCPSASDFCPSA